MRIIKEPATLSKKVTLRNVLPDSGKKGRHVQPCHAVLGITQSLFKWKEESLQGSPGGLHNFLTLAAEKTAQGYAVFPVSNKKELASQAHRWKKDELDWKCDVPGPFTLLHRFVVTSSTMLARKEKSATL